VVVDDVVELVDCVVVDVSVVVDVLVVVVVEVDWGTATGVGCLV